jgi:transglutaminase-like putative cysteine protease
MKNYLIILIVFLFQISFAQKKCELGKVTIEELNQKVHAIDSSASASIIFKSGVSKLTLTGDKWVIRTTVKYKIKIYKKEGLKFADFSVPYYSASNNENVFFSNAYTYNLVDGKIEKTKLKSEGEFKEKINENWSKKKITLPNVKVGSIIEFSYESESSLISTFDDWRFQTTIPTDYVEYYTYIPKYFNYNTVITGYEQINNKSEILSSGSYEEIKSSYFKADIPALKDEEYVDNIDNYSTILKYELAAIQYPNQPLENFAMDWEGVVKSIYSNDRFGYELNKNGYYEEDLKLILKDLTTQEEKINAIFNFVKSKVKWNEYRGVYCSSNGVKGAYKDGVGNVAEINLMLTSMLRFAQIEANPILVSTRQNGVTVFPSRTSYDYVICGIEISNEVILLDATDKNSVSGQLPTRAINWTGRIIRKNESSAEISLFPKKISNLYTNIMVTITEDGSVEGTVREQHFDYNAFRFRTKYGDLSKESYLEGLEKRRENIEINDYEILNKKELDKPVVENYSFKSANSVEIIGDKLIFSPLLFFVTKDNPFKQENRKYPIDFIYPKKLKYIINISTPEGYILESIPKSVSIPMTDKVIDVKYLIDGTDNRVQLIYTIDINESMISAEYYEELKAIFDEIIKKENEKIIMKKV